PARNGHRPGRTLARLGRKRPTRYTGCGLIQSITIGIHMSKATTTDTLEAKPKGAVPAPGSQPQPAEAKKAKASSAGLPRQPGVERRRNHPNRAKNGYIELILTQSLPQLGQPGDVVKVRPGFARNYLVPQGLATFATQTNLRMVAKHRQRLKELEEARRADLQNLAAQVAQRSLTIEANANAEGHLY